MGPAAGAPDTQACLPQEPSSSAEEMASRALSITPSPKPRRNKKSGCIVWSLVPLRVALFFFFGGLGCLLIFLPLHMQEVGLSDEHQRLVSIVAPLVSILGPLIVGPAADRLGKHKVLLTACLLLSAATYCLLLAVPVTSPQGMSYHADASSRAPAVKLTCDPDGATIIQHRCASECPRWDQTWEVEIRDCHLDCVHPTPSSSPTPTMGPVPGGIDENPDEEAIEPEAPALPPPEPNYDDDDDGGEETTESQQGSDVAIQALGLIGPLKPQPYLCFSNDTGSEVGGRLCHVFTKNSQGFLVNASLAEVVSIENECRYSLTHTRLQLGNQSFSALLCRAPEDCTVRCDLGGPLWERVSESGTQQQLCPAPASLTDPSTTFWSYLLARSVADIFPAAAVPLADTLVVALVRDHHSDVGRELAWGAVGAGLLVPGVCALVLADITPWPETPSALPILAFAFLSLLAAAALSGVKLQPAWYSRRMEFGGIPGPRITHRGEAWALFAVLVILGFFWSALDTYLPWFLVQEGNSTSTLGLTVTLGTLLAFPLLWNSERLIDYCGHTNLFIVAFAFYIIRLTGFGFLEASWLGVSFEIFEVFTMCVMWTTAVVYSRLLVAKQHTATGQAMIFLAHFCLGRFLGALVGGATLAAAGKSARWQLYQALALVAALLGWLYFSIYHCCLRPRCGKKSVPPTSTDPVDGVTSNGSYTPLRVYNGEQKREMRY